MLRVNSPLVFALTSSAIFSTCSVNARCLPHKDTSHCCANTSPETASATAAHIPVLIILLNITLPIYFICTVSVD